MLQRVFCGPSPATSLPMVRGDRKETDPPRAPVTVLNRASDRYPGSQNTMPKQLWAHLYSLHSVLLPRADHTTISLRADQVHAVLVDSWKELGWTDLGPGVHTQVCTRPLGMERE